MEREEISVPWNKNRNFFLEVPMFIVRVAKHLPEVRSMFKEHGENYKYVHHWSRKPSWGMKMVIVFSDDSEPPAEAMMFDPETKSLD